VAIVRIRPADLQLAIKEDALTLQFQPQVQVRTGKLVGAEAFVRWPHPAYGMIGPGDIIPLVEQGGFHTEFDRWVVRALCEQMTRWVAEGFDVPVVAVNLWSQTLRAADGVDMVQSVLAATGVRAKSLEIECPRGTVKDQGLAWSAMRLRVVGVRVASEEFGDRALAKSAAGYDTLKIGYPVARDLLIAGSPSAQAVSAIVDAARASGARVVADSVETEEQEDALQALGCEIVQGYLYGPEVSATELKQLATAGARRVEREES
jgi:EAL domain-containing protein (putative c-di-GMP-specific phosphodiesterase class I)